MLPTLEISDIDLFFQQYLHFESSSNCYHNIRDRKTRYTKMIHNGRTVEWKGEIGGHGCTFAMVTSQTRHFHVINEQFGGSYLSYYER